VGAYADLHRTFVLGKRSVNRKAKIGNLLHRLRAKNWGYIPERVFSLVVKFEDCGLFIIGNVKYWCKAITQKKNTQTEATNIALHNELTLQDLCYLFPVFIYGWGGTVQ
jgi:hypothetical protein